jgi:hypothetical protein
MPAADTELRYLGPVISGATLGAWEARPISEQRRERRQVFRHRTWEIKLPYLAEPPRVADAERELSELVGQEAEARLAGNEQIARDLRALAERQRRLLERIRPLPAGDRYPFTINAWQLGDTFWVAIEGEPYQFLQRELMRRFSDHPLIVIPLSNGARCSYLPTRDAYKKTLYQVEVALLAAGCLETITDEIAQQITAWIAAS